MNTNNISFCANLIVDKNLYEKMPKGTPEGYSENLIKGYQDFLNHRVMEQITQGDTIELYKEKYNKGFALGIRYISDNFEKPIESGIYTNKKIPSITLGDLIYDVMTFIIIKSGIKQKISKSHQENFIEAAKELLKKQV